MNRGKTSLATILLISLLAGFLFACGTAEVATRSGPAAERAEESRTADVTPTVTGVTTATEAKETRIVIAGNRLLTFTSFLLPKPPQIMVDVSAGAGPSVLGVTAIMNGTVDNIQAEPVAGMENLLRFRINLAAKTNYQVIRDNSNLVVLIENLPGTVTRASGAAGKGEQFEIPDEPLTPQQTSGGTAEVTGVDFQPLDPAGRTRLVIRTNKVVQPDVSARDSGRTVILSLSPARIPSHLTRHLDTSYFRSAIDFVKPAQAGARQVNFIIKLREATPYHLGQKGVVTYMDFDPSAVSPKKVELPAAGAAGPAAAERPSAPAKAPDKEEKMAVQPAGSEWKPTKTYKGSRISLDFQNADIHNILRLIGEVSGKNMVVSDQVTGKVTLKLKDVPWDQALDIVLQTQQLGMVEAGNVIRVAPSSVLRAEKEAYFAEQEQEIKREQLAPLQQKVFTPKYLSAMDMAQELSKILPGGRTESGETTWLAAEQGRGRVTVVGNDIYVQADAPTLSQMEGIFDKYDRAANQVLIESRIIEALTSFSKNLGVNWGGHWTQDDPNIISSTTETWGLYGLGAPAGGGAAAIGSGGAAVNLITPPATGLGLGFGIISDTFSLDAKLYAMEQTGEGRIVSAPRILANNDEEVHIKQGQSVPYETTSANGTEIQYKEAVLALNVKPHIEENGKIITMDITVTKDTPNYQLTTRNPPIDTREAKTKLMVKDGETVVIGGIIIDEKSKSINRVPGLHRVPIIGYLFKNYQISDTKTELLIFLTSHVIPVKI